MRRASFLLFFALLVGLLAGCGRKEITPLQRKQAASYASEASFALTLRDYPRAEGLLAQAVEACADTPDYWVTLGSVRRKMDNRPGAKKAFESGLKASRDAFKREPKNTQLLLQQVYVLALLGRADDAREALEKAQKNYPDDRSIRSFVEAKELDRLLADPGFKEISL